MNHVESHMAVDAVIGQLICHDTTGSVADQDVNTVSFGGNLVRRGLDFQPIRDIAWQPGDFLRRFLPHLLADGLEGIIDHFSVHRHDKDMLDVLRQHRVSATVADALRATSDHSHFAGQIWDLLESKAVLLIGKAMGLAPKVLGNGGLDAINEGRHDSSLCYSCDARIVDDSRAAAQGARE